MDALTQKAQAIRLVILDVDGVLSDGGIYVTDHGEFFKRFYVRDGLGIKMLQKAGIPVAIITGRESQILKTRCEELGITELYQNQRFKVPAFEALLKKLGIDEQAVAYMGDDIPDLPLLKRVGLSSSPSDADPDIQALVNFVSPFPGGQGAVRSLAELILRAQGRWFDLVEQTFEQGR